MIFAVTSDNTQGGLAQCIAYCSLVQKIEDSSPKRAKEGMRRHPMPFDATFSLKSVRNRSVLAGLALLLLLAAVAGVSLWRAQSDRDARNSLEQRALAVAALESARAQLFLNATFTAIGVFADDPAPFVDQYQKGHLTTTKAMQAARDKLAAVGGPDEAAPLDKVGADVERLLQDADAVMASFLTMSRDERLETAQETQQRLWPAASTAIVELEQLAQEQAAKLSAERTAADSAAQNTLALLITFSVAAFLTACAALSMLHISITRPLTALRASARAVTLGDLEARANEFGPEEVASVAHDFNEMTQALLDRTGRLLQSEQQFRDVLDVSRDLVYKLNLETRTYDYVSPSASELLGFTPEEVATMGLEGIRARFHPEDRERFRTFPRDLPPDSGEHRLAPAIEYRWKCRNGEYRWFSDNRAIVRDQDGKVLAVVGTVRDITSRKQAEEALRESEEKFRSLSASAPIGIFLTDAEGKCIYANEHLLEIAGLSFEEALGYGWTNVIHPDDRQAAIDDATISAKENRDFSKEFRLVPPHGDECWVHVTATSMLSASGEQGGRVGTIEDITARRRSEDALRESEERFRSLSASAPVGIFSTDLEGKFIYANEHLADTLGVPPEELLGRVWTKSIHPYDFRATLADALKAGAEIRTFSREYRILRPEGEVRWIRTVSSPTLSGDGSLLCYVGATEDITERRRAEGDLRESEERFRTLSASAPIGIFLSDARGNSVYANENAVALIGGTSEDGLGTVWNKYIHPDDREAVMAEGAVAAVNRRKFSMEYRILTKAGEERWVHTTIIATRSPVGVVTGYLGTIEDVTERRRAEEEMANRLRMESAIAQASNLLAKPEDADAALDLPLAILGEAFGVERAHVFLLQDKADMHCVGEWCSPGMTGADNLYDFNAAVFPWSAQKLMRAEPIVVTDTSALPPEAAVDKKLWEAMRVRSVLAISLTSGGRIIGCAIFDNTARTRDWREEDVRLLRLASESISSFLERRRAGEERRGAYENTVTLLAVAAEARDPYTESHLQRIRGYSEAIASELGLSPEETRDIGLASLLHDLGKMRVPDHILTKPGPLTDEEWRIMKQHPLWGEELLPPHAWFRLARQVARWHHENWDGEGYPDGLRGEEIPIAAAITAVADGFDAMTTQRPYKSAWPPGRAIKEIRDNKGLRYSPKVVAAFERALRKGEIKRVATTSTPSASDLTEAA